MGEVYRARDTKLDREVAIKVLPSALAKDPERLARFEREARVLASLNHPNIAQIYGVVERSDGESDGARALVMELVPGGTVRGPLSLETALGYAKQIVAALEAAHEKGITHRDLKPANIMITPAGVVKVLDFGLAAVSQPSGPQEVDPSRSPTLTMAGTQAGMILGTASYMSPEQAAGQPADRRADIWAYGVVLWEMLTGKQLFHGQTISHTLASVLKDEPDFELLPVRVRGLMRACLAKDPAQRLASISDARFLLRGGEEAGSNAGSSQSVATSRHGKLGWLAAGVMTAAALVLGAVGYRHFTESPLQVTKLSILPPGNAELDTLSIPAVSPDGRLLVFVATSEGKSQLWVRDLDSVSAHPLSGTEGASEPFWSPDSSTIAFFADGKLKKTGVANDAVQTICDVSSDALGGTWGSKDVIVFAGVADSTSRVSSAGGSATAVTTPDRAAGESYHHFPWFLPDGRHFLYTAAHLQEQEKTAVYVSHAGREVADFDQRRGAIHLEPRRQGALFHKCGPEDDDGRNQRRLAIRGWRTEGPV